MGGVYDREEQDQFRHHGPDRQHVRLGSGAANADALEGKVFGGGQPIANSTVTLWAANEGAPQQLGQARTGADGGFTLNSTVPTGAATLYLIAKGGQPQANAQSGDNPAIALMTVIGSNSRRP